MESAKVPWTVPKVNAMAAMVGWNLKGIFTPLKIIRPNEAVMINKESSNPKIKD